MKWIAMILLAGALALGCNSSGNSTNMNDSTALKDKTNMNDTGTSRTIDTAIHKDTSVLPNKMEDTAVKK